MGVFINANRNHVPSITTLSNNVVENAESSMICDLMKYDERGFNIVEEFAVASYISSVDLNVDIVTEGLSDFLESAAKFFKDLLVRIGKFFKDVITYIGSYLTSFESFVERNKDKFSNSGKVRVKGFKYSLDKDIPNVDIIDTIVNKFNKDVARMEEMTFEEVRDEMNKYNHEEGSNIIRATIVQSPTPLEQSEVSAHVKKMFRSDEEEPDYIDFNSAEIASIASDYKSFRKEVQKIRKEQIKLEKMLGSIRAAFERGPRFEYKGSSKQITGHTISKNDKGIYRQDESVEIKNKLDVTRVANLYYSFRFSQLKDLTNTIVATSTAKTNAYKEQMKLYEKVLRKAIFGGENDDN